jgi:copper chaperone CopZ
MKKTYKLQNLGCAHCAAKMEAGIKKLEGVRDASINFMASRLTIDAEEGAFEKIFPNAEAICRRIEPKCRIVI